MGNENNPTWEKAKAIREELMKLETKEPIYERVYYPDGDGYIRVGSNGTVKWGRDSADKKIAKDFAKKMMKWLGNDYKED